MIRRPPRSTQSRSSAASDVYKRQRHPDPRVRPKPGASWRAHRAAPAGSSVAPTCPWRDRNLLTRAMTPIKRWVRASAQVPRRNEGGRCRNYQKRPDVSRGEEVGRAVSAGFTSRDGRSALALFSNCHPFSLIELPESRSATYDDRLLAALIHHDGGAVRVKCVLEECEVERAPEQRATQGHHSLDHGTR